MEIIEFEGQLFEFRNLSNPEDVIDEALLAAHLYQMSLDSKAIESIKECSRCGRLVPGGGEVGCIDDNDAAHSFCDYDCYAKWNLMHGLGPLGEVFLDDGLGGRRW